jgi:hypothetical protein
MTMTPLDGQDAGCTGRLAIDPVTGIADCTACGFHGKPLLHLAYSIARTANLNPARAILYALSQTHYLTEAAAAHKSRADVAQILTASAAATAARLARSQQRRTPMNPPCDSAKTARSQADTDPEATVIAAPAAMTYI